MDREETKNNIINEIKDLYYKSTDKTHLLLDFILLVKKLKEFDDIMTVEDKRDVLKACHKYTK